MRLGWLFAAGVFALVVSGCAESDDAGAGKTRGILAAANSLGAAPSGTAVRLGEGDWLNEKDKNGLGWRWQDEELVIEPGSGNLRTRENFGDCRIHVEFNVEATDGVEWKADGNSGVYIQRRYELQILNSYGRSASDESCGALYTQRAPDSNASLPAGEWQTFDIVFRAPRWAGDKRVEKARLTAVHNGTLIHDDVPISGSTGAGKPEAASEEPLRLQDHGSVVSFRNIWIERLELN